MLDGLPLSWKDFARRSASVDPGCLAGQALRASDEQEEESRIVAEAKERVLSRAMDWAHALEGSCQAKGIIFFISSYSGGKFWRTQRAVDGAWQGSVCHAAA